MSAGRKGAAIISAQTLRPVFRYRDRSGGNADRHQLNVVFPSYSQYAMPGTRIAKDVPMSLCRIFICRACKRIVSGCLIHDGAVTEYTDACAYCTSAKRSAKPDCAASIRGKKPQLAKG